MKKKVVGYMIIGLLAMAMMVQGQSMPRARQSVRSGDNTERVSPMNRMGSMNGPRTGAVRPGQFEQRGAIAVPGNRKMERGAVAPGFGMRNRQGGLQGGLQAGRVVDPEKRIENEVEQLKQSLDLSSKQVKKITDIKKKQAKKEIKAYKKSQKKSEARRKKIQAPNDKIKSVLTEEQVKKFESSRPRVGSGQGFRLQR